MSYKVVLAALGVALAAVFGTWGAAAALHAGSSQAGLVEAIGPSVTPTSTATPEPSPTLSPSPSPSPSVTPTITPAAPAAPAAPAPAAPAKPAPTISAVTNAGATMLQASVDGILPFSIEAEIRLVAGATVRCWVEAGGQVFESEEIVGEGWIGDRHPLSAFGDVVLAPADYAFTAHCTTSDGVAWSQSGTAVESEFLSYGS